VLVCPSAWNVTHLCRPRTSTVPVVGVPFCSSSAIGAGTTSMTSLMVSMARPVRRTLSPPSHRLPPFLDAATGKRSHPSGMHARRPAAHRSPPRRPPPKNSYPCEPTLASSCAAVARTLLLSPELGTLAETRSAPAVDDQRHSRSTRCATGARLSRIVHSGRLMLDLRDARNHPGSVSQQPVRAAPKRPL
jgi:hypothetical protein